MGQSQTFKFASQPDLERVEKPFGFVEKIGFKGVDKGVDDKGLEETVLKFERVERSLLARDLPLWRGTESSIERVFDFSSFRAAIDFVVQVAQEAERVQHHPEITISWKTVKLILTTYEIGGLTEKDVFFALICDRLIAPQSDEKPDQTQLS